MRYATFWQRLLAALIDVAVLLPFVVLFVWLQDTSRLAAMALLVPAAAFFAAYPVYFHGRFGKTVGKHLAGIKIVRADGIPVGFPEAWRRSSVDIVFAASNCAGQYIALQSLSDLQYSAASGWMEKAQLVQSHQPTTFGWLVIASNAWVWSELVTMLLNKRRRALHDFIAGTVVVQAEKVPQSTHAAA